MTFKVPVRVNTKISYKANEWLDLKSAEMGLSKSALINIAVENYIKENEVVSVMPQIIEQLKVMGLEVKEQ